ncbi:MAG: ABC transporter ATP-binding protein [Candidatus Odinarchaeia archaeon]
MEVSIEVKDLTKRFGKFTAVDHLNFDIKKGEIFGLLGPNGAGKTTTLRMLCTLLPPSEGTAIVEGFDIRKEVSKIRRILGVVSEGVDLYEDLTARENLRLLGRLYNIPKKELNYRIEELLESIGLADWGDSLVKTYSTGMRKKLHIVAALLHNPKVLLLDEVTSGLDPQTSVSIREMARALSDEHDITIIWTTHYIEEPEKICDRVAIITNGKILAIGPPEKIKEKAIEGYVIEISCATYVDLNIITEISNIEGVLDVQYDTTKLTILARKDKNVLNEALKIIAENNLPVLDVKKRAPSLEEAFIKLIQQTKEGAKVEENTY